MDFVFADYQSAVQRQYPFTITGPVTLSAKQFGMNSANQTILAKEERSGATAEIKPDLTLYTIIPQECLWDIAGEYAGYSGSILDLHKSKI